jgi:hypothetical protein
MIYLITFDINNLIKINETPQEMKGVYRGYDAGLPSFDIVFDSPKYSSELYDDSGADGFGSVLSEFAGESILILHYNTFLIKWERPLEELFLKMNSILNKYDRFAIIEFNGKIITNFKTQEQLAIDHFIKIK